MLPSKGIQKLCFTYEEDDKLVEFISSQPAIYDFRNPLYKDQRAKDNIWVETSEEVGRSVADCKKRWRNIKDTYDRRAREIKNCPEASVCKRAKKWQLEDKLAFLNSVDIKRKSFHNINEDYEESADDEEDDSVGFNHPKFEHVEILEAAAVVVPPPHLSPKQLTTKEVLIQTDQPKETDVIDRICFAIENRSKKRDTMVKKLVDKDDETDVTLFFKSIAKSVEQLPPYLQQRAKLETLTVISNIESEMWASGQGTSGGNQIFTVSSPAGCD